MRAPENMPNHPNSPITRAEYERLPKLPEGVVWMRPMQDMADKLKKEYETLNTDAMTDAEVEAYTDRMMERISSHATDSMKHSAEWSDMNFLSYLYWACMEETEFWDEVASSEVENEEERTLRAEGMLRLHVLFGWLQAINARIEELGGKIEG